MAIYFTEYSHPAITYSQPGMENRLSRIVVVRSSYGAQVLPPPLPVFSPETPWISSWSFLPMRGW